MKVLSVVGAGRSGTTVLASILGEVDGFASVGELRWVWDRGVRQQRPCGCGEPPLRCPVWSQVITKTLASLPVPTTPADVDRIIACQRELARRRNLPRVLRSVDGSEGDWEALRFVREVTRSACVAVAEVTGARVVVDTSKRPLDAAVLAGAPQMDHYVLHIVRDPRAVAHSWRRSKSFTTAGQTRTMGTRRLPSTVRRWTANSLSAQMLRRRLAPARWHFLRYEDFAAKPRTAVDEIVRFLGEGGRTPFTDDHTVLLHANHIVAGNPSRFRTGPVAIRADEEWKTRMPRRDRLLVEAATLPLMLRYGYAELRRRDRPGGS